MSEFLFTLIGVVLGAGAVYLRLRGKYAAQPQANAQKDNEEYYKLWSEVVSLLGLNGQLTPEQIAKITPTVKQATSEQASTTAKLPQGQGFSDDRRDIEIMRAEKGLPPADNLHGMFSDDVRAVHEARIEHGTAQ